MTGTGARRADRPGWGASIRGHLRDGPAIMSCLRIALVVGTIYTLINQAERLVPEAETAVLWVRVALNFAVPFCVASLGYITARRNAMRA